MVEKAAEIKEITSEIVRRINEDTRRIKLLEQTSERIQTRMDQIEEAVLNQMNDLKIDLDKISIKINSVSDRLKAIENEIIRINKDLAKTATKAEVKQLETFIDLINPITSKFITKDQLERALEERLAKKA